MLKHLKYGRYLVRHKWFVLVAGLRTGAPLWRLIIHDWSKFTPREWRAYADYFYGGTLNWEAKQLAFNRAWLAHQHRNPHHWQHWVLREDSGITMMLPIPEQFVREMVADWAGAGRAITGTWDVQTWYRANSMRLLLHVPTRALVERLVATVGEIANG